MADWPVEERRRGERRKDRTPRRGARRSGEDRRKQEGAPAPEAPLRSQKARRARVRRAGRRRRRWDRRVGDRRAPGPDQFSRDELARVRELIVSPRLPFECPHCKGALALGYPIGRHGHTVRGVRCTACQRSCTFPDYSVVRVLVIEESSKVCDELRKILSDAGHEVVCARGGAAAAEAHRDDPPDLVIVDSLSTATEAEFLGTYRREFPNVRLIAVARKRVHGVGDPLAVAGTLGAQVTLRRPLTPADLLRALDAALELVRPG
jgi:CheY-like chemotaxis protein